MFHWVLMFESGEQIIARGHDPSDRVAEYAAKVDSARLQGRRYALVARTAPRRYEVVVNPDPVWIEANFPRAPQEQKRSKDNPPLE